MDYDEFRTTMTRLNKIIWVLILVTIWLLFTDGGL